MEITDFKFYPEVGRNIDQIEFKVNGQCFRERYHHRGGRTQMRNFGLCLCDIGDAIKRQAQFGVQREIIHSDYHKEVYL